MAAEQFSVELARLADDNKCEDIAIMDLRGRSSVTDFFVIASGSSDRQLRSTADLLKSHAKKLGEKPYSICGYDTASWILVDFVDVVVHLFLPVSRQYYDLELMWGDAPRISWARSASA